MSFRHAVACPLAFATAWMPHASVCLPVREDVNGVVVSPNGNVDFEGASG